MNTKVKAVTVLLALIAFGCGGGGGGSGSSANSGTGNSVPDSPNGHNSTGDTSGSYAPDGSLKMIDASQSSDLYVEENFSFESSSSIYLQVSASDINSAPVRFTRIEIYLVPDTIENWSDENLDYASLISSGITDATGTFSRTMDIQPYRSQLLLVLDTVGIENKTLLPIDSDSLAYHFE